MMMSDTRTSTVIQEWNSTYQGQVHNQGLNPISSNPASQMTQMDMMSYSQSQGLVRGGGDRMAEQHMTGLSYLSYGPSCLSNTMGPGSINHHQNQLAAQQEFSQFALPSPPMPLRAQVTKRTLSKDSMEYRMRRERNNVAVRKSRDKARRRIVLTQQRATQLQEDNQRLQMRIGQLTQELDTLKHILSQRHGHVQVKEDRATGDTGCC